jgi:HD-GYP domain-containing protein (c-di-GMP phosphodiesterase class II)
METLQYAGLLHDIGKVLIDGSVLTKTEPLTAQEWDEMRRHPAIGAEMMSSVPFLEKARPMVLYHHERYDGKGYPEGLKGEEIPIGARIIAAANAYDAMTNDSLFKPARTIDDAVKQLRDNSGTQFCPVAAKALISGLHLSNTVL